MRPPKLPLKWGAREAISVLSTTLVGAPEVVSHTYRVEHRTGGISAVIGRVVGAPAHHATLTVFASTLRRAGVGGMLVLVAEATGDVAAQIHLGNYSTERCLIARTPRTTAGLARRALLTQPAVRPQSPLT